MSAPTAPAPEGAPDAATPTSPEEAPTAVTRVSGTWRLVVIGLTLAGITVTLSQAFFINPFGGTLLANQYLYVVLACFLPIVFISFPATATRGRDHVPAYDVALAVLAGVTLIYFGVNAELILTEGWDYVSPTPALIGSFVLWALVLETLRRTAGGVVTVIAAIFSVYPLFAAGVPIGFLEGIQYDLPGVARKHAMGVESILGLPLSTAAAILVGFLVFGVVLQRTGGAAFFHDFARSVFGTARGGPAKVSIVSSASMGMMSGSAVSNVLTTGPLTIPAMKKSGFSGEYAAGVEATASSGGSITPPIMGTAAFLMVAFIGVPYGEIAVAAAIPALLYYVGIYTQVDAYAARQRLRGEARSALPHLGRTLLAGWPYLAALAVLMYLLIAVGNEAQAPFWVVGALLAYALLRPKDRMGLGDLADTVAAVGRTLAEIIGIIAGVGLIIGGLSMTGVSLSLARELVNAVGGSVALILIAGAITSFVLGMGMTVSAVYVLLAIVMAPALVTLGIDPIAAHLFVIYWATVSYITPPVALASFAAAGIAGTRPMRTSLVAMRLGMVKYVIPFCFALNPALVAQAPLPEVLMTLALALVGVVVMACSFEGYAPGVARVLPTWIRVAGVPTGFAILLPELTTSLIGLAVAAGLAVTARVMGTAVEQSEPTAVAA